MAQTSKAKSVEVRASYQTLEEPIHPSARFARFTELADLKLRKRPVRAPKRDDVPIEVRSQRRRERNGELGLAGPVPLS